jgi:hypothetical protein
MREKKNIMQTKFKRIGIILAPAGRVVPGAMDMGA